MRKLAAIAAAGALALSVAAAGVAQAHTEQYRADLSGANEVPAVDSDASGNFKLKVTHTDARFDLKVKNLVDLTQAHIHLGAPGENGGVVVWLHQHEEQASAPIAGAFSGRLSKDVITPDDLVGALADDWEGFREALDAGLLYVNVHTDAHPGGEIRGQIEAHPG